MTTSHPETSKKPVISPLSRQQSRDADRAAIEELGIPGIVLMENAGRGCAELLSALGIKGDVLVCAGKGNNGGDGFVIARHLAILGFNTDTWLFCDPEELRGDALTNYQILNKAGLPIKLINDPNPETINLSQNHFDWIVDALLGTGTQGEVREPYPEIIRQINENSAKKLAIDLPSGMDCDTGQPLGICVRADHTAALIAPKIGFDQPGAERWTGQVHTIGIGIPPS